MVSLLNEPCFVDHEEAAAVSCFQPMSVFQETLVRTGFTWSLLLSPDASWKSAILRRNLRRPTEGVHRATDVERVECSADLLEVKGARMSSKSSSWTAGRDAAELLTTAQTATSRGVVGTGLHLRPDRSDQTSTTREPAQDVQELSMSSAWCSGDWNGDAATCRSTSAGAVRLRSPTIETSYAD